MGLSKPTFSFTIPSTHDDLPLDCRLYHPSPFTNVLLTGKDPRFKKGAIIAHPYAPLGGSYDDPVVELVASELLRRRFGVGTFNFRGASGSKGRTSWTAKAELADYVSFVGFFVHYLHLLQSREIFSSFKPSTSPSAIDELPGGLQDTRGTAASAAPLGDPITLILGGYSYGAMITSHLPPLDTIMGRFSEAAPGTAAVEILVRARELAGDWDVAAERDPHRQGNTFVLSGGAGAHSKTGIPVPRTQYLLISPLLPPISSLATFFSKPRSSTNGRDNVSNLITCPTLAVYGSNDMFTSAKKLRKWGSGLAAKPGSRFQYKEVKGAGHFWSERGAAEQLVGSVRQWVRDVAPAVSR